MFDINIVFHIIRKIKPRYPYEHWYFYPCIHNIIYPIYDVYHRTTYKDLQMEQKGNLSTDVQGNPPDPDDDLYEDDKSVLISMAKSNELGNLIIIIINLTTWLIEG